MSPAASTLCALALASAVSAQDVVPVDGHQRAAPELREALSLVDLEASEWVEEAHAEKAKKLLGRLVRALEGAEGVPDVPLAADFACSDLWWSREAPPETDLETPRGHRVRRAPAAGGEHRGADGLRTAIEAFRAGAGEVRELEWKVVAYEPLEGGFLARLLVHGFARDGERATERTARWATGWRLGDDGLALRSLRVEDLTEVAGEPLGTTGALPLTRPPARDWTLGMNELGGFLDRRLGTLFVGAAAGIAVGDVNGDGREDLYLSQPGGLPNRLLLARPDRGAFEDASAGSGADFLDFSRSALLLPLDADEHLDLVVNLGTEVVFLRGDGRGRFERVQALEAQQMTTMAAADYDLDGDLDVYVCCYFTPYEGTGFPVPYHDANNGQANLLLENRSEGEELRFVDVTVERGLDENNRRFTLAASWEDYDGDGDPDLYVANDFGRNNLYRNDEGRFRDVAAEAGVEDVSAGMGVDWADVDGDGFMDLLVSNMFSAAGGRIAYQRNFHESFEEESRELFQRHARGNSLFRNRGDGTFEDISLDAGITMGRWAWGAIFGDWNSDGRPDIFVPNGFVTGRSDDDL